MKGKLSLAAVAVAFAMLATPGTASAHFNKHGWCKKDCFLGWMHHGHCKKVVKKKHATSKMARKSHKHMK